MTDLLRKYARLAVRDGVNLQPGQILMIYADIESYAFARIVTEEAYACGAKEVVVRYEDAQISRLHYLHQSDDTLCRVRPWQLESRLDYLKEGACILHIISDVPGVFKDCDARKIAQAKLAYAKASKEIQRYTMNNLCSWSIIAVPNEQWAQQVFEECSAQEALDRLWSSILASVHVNRNSDPIEVWNARNAMFEDRVKALNDYAFDALHFKSELGTDLEIALVNGHIWEGGSEKNASGVSFNPNLPTEEVFTMPHRLGVNGIVYASRPLDYNGVLIKDFYLRFEKGKVVDYDAREGKQALASLLSFDEGSSYLGEVALVADDSPISRSKIMYYNTLFDENASCHLAMGDTYPSCICKGLSMSEDELRRAGGNQSLTHVDFMFGTPHLTVKGIRRGKKDITVMENGNFTDEFQ